MSNSEGAHRNLSTLGSYGNHYTDYHDNHNDGFHSNLNDTYGDFVWHGGGMSKDEIERLLEENNQPFFETTNFDLTTQILLIIVFAALIIFGATGNGLVCYVVAKNPHMRTPRNIFIINLAISDLTLCLFTQPFNLMKVSMPVWHLGGFMCKFVPMCAGTNVFVSTISITAIALDRFQVIVYPTKESMMRLGSIIALLSIWTISLLMASPLLVFNVKKSVEIFEGVVLYDVCLENPDLHYEKGAYSIASMIFQYIVPILLVTVAHARICFKLKYRMVNQQRTVTSHSPFLARKKAAERRRKRKTNIMLVMIAVVFSCSWMPLNVFNIMADFNHTLLQRIDTNGLIFPICHLLVLSSACINPVLYGWLNDNFRKEFVLVLSCGRQGANGQRQGRSGRDRGHRNNTHQNGANNRAAGIEDDNNTLCVENTRLVPVSQSEVCNGGESACAPEVAEADLHMKQNGSEV